MGKIFHLLYRHILRPGLRIFGLQAFIKSGENQWISGVEAQLRALERDMEAKGKSHVCPLIDNSISDQIVFETVDSDKLGAWVAATIETTAPLRDISQNVEGIRDAIFEMLSPLLKSAPTLEKDKVKKQILAICEKAVYLKLAMRRYPGNYKIEVPSRDVRAWGEAGCDKETRDLKPVAWLQVIDHEFSSIDKIRGDASTGTKKRGDVAYISFGALTKFDKEPNGRKHKVVLEKGWVIARGHAGQRRHTSSMVTERDRY